MAEVQVRAVSRAEVGSSFVDEAVGLLDRAFGGWPRLELTVPAPDHLRWKMDGPHPEFPAALIAELDGKLVGFRTLLARDVLVRGEAKLFLHFVDGAVDPTMQGRGVNRAIQDRMQSEFHPQFDLSIDDSTNETIVRGRVRLGAINEFGNQVLRFMRPISIRGLFHKRRAERGVVPAVVGAVADVVVRVAALRSRITPPVVHEFELRTVASCDERFDVLCAEALADFDFAPARDAAFLNWRYAAERAGQFAIRTAERDGTLLGYAVTNVASPEASLADILVAPETPEAVDALIVDAITLARSAGAAGITCWLPRRHPYAPALRRAGFAALGRSTSLRHRAVSMPEEELAFLNDANARLHLTHGDTDLI